MSKKLWGGRFNASTHPEVEQFTASIHVDQALAYDDLLGSMAHAAMLGQRQILDQHDAQILQHGLATIAQKIEAGKLQFRMEDEDIHMNIERLLHAEIGDVAGKLHTARSRNDQVALDLHLYLRRQTVDILDRLLQLQEQLVQLAQSHRDVVVPGYTHLQRAQPVILSQYFLAYAAMLQRDSERLQSTWSRVNQSPLGAGALNGSSFGIDKHDVASLLKFNAVYLNNMDAVSDRDFVIEFLSIASLIMMHLSRLSEELILWSSQEFNFIEMGDAFCTGSSMMPQKKNPDVAELTRGKTGRVYGSLMNLLTLMKGLPLTYNRDLQEDKEPLFDTVKTLQAVLTVYTPLLSSLTINRQAMFTATQKGFLNATALAEYLVKKKVAFRTAHEIVGKMVAHCTQKNCTLEELSLAQMREFSNAIDESVYEALSLETIAHAHDAELDHEIAFFHEKISQTQAWIDEKHQLMQKVSEQFKLSDHFSSISDDSKLPT